MTTYITLISAYQHKNIDLHGYILSSKRELIAQNQALERADKGKFSLVPNVRQDTNLVWMAAQWSRLLLPSRPPP
jgi:hypothetical protein